MRVLIKRNAHEQRKATLRIRLLIQVLAVAISDRDARTIELLQDEMKALRAFVKN